jgi:hypothetical protein
MDTKTKNPQQQIMQLITSNWISRLIYTAAYLRIPDMLTGGEMHIDDIAEKCGVQETA